jgi:formylglycine-generating enzyme required for sulfatase activity
MAHDVFISHSSNDKQIADALCNKLESNGIRCWIAPRDIWPGRKWSEAIVQAIGESSLMLLVFSTSANTSDHIGREVEIAAKKRLPILPFRVDDVQPSGALEYYLATPHWLDAMTPPMEQHLNQLVVSVKRLLPIPPGETTPAHQTVPASPMPEPPVAPPANEISARAPDDGPLVLTNQVGIELVYVPAGEFMMGSQDWGNDEKPAHQVTIRNWFYMGKYPVTQAQWRQVMGYNPSEFKGDNLPVDGISWLDAQQFTLKLCAMNDGFIYRFPSEAEWEYACRAGTTGDHAGNLDSMAWYGNNSGREYLHLAERRWSEENEWKDNWKRIEDNGNQAHPVGQKQPNAFGLYDMHGNVGELCQDNWHDNYDGAPTDGSAWLGGSSSRVSRGGTWKSDAEAVRSACRVWTPAAVDLYGLRLVAVRGRSLGF